MNIHGIKQRMQNHIMEHHAKENKGRRRTGFTLVELIVVLALISIIAAFSVGAMLVYTNYADFKRNNENARTIFSAAQSAVTYYKASGRLEKLRKKVEELEQTPAFVPEAAFEADKELTKDEDEKRRDDTISYLMLSATDGEQISDAFGKSADPENALKSLNPEARLLFDMLRDYITDTSIYEASICVEFDATDGVVSGVLYCDRARSFSYERDKGMDIMNITDRSESHREDVALGYYSTALSARAPQEVGDLEIAQAIIKNAETLDVQWFLPKEYQYLKRDQGYTITLSEQAEEEEDYKRRVEIELSPEAVGGITVESGANAYVKAEKVTLYDADDNSYVLSDGTDGAGIRFHAYLAQNADYGSGIALSLDALDLELAEAMKKTDSTERQEALLETYSARRLSYTDDSGKHYGLNLDSTAQIQANVSISGKEGDSVKSTASACLLFADGEKAVDAGNVYTYEIANARHLYNVRFREQDEISPADTVKYEITQDFAWGGPNGILSFTTENPAGGSDTGVITPSGTLTKVFNKGTIKLENENGKVPYPAFPSIVCLRENSTLESKPAEEPPEAGDSSDAAVYTIGYLALEPERTAAADGTASLEKNVGLVRENKGTIRNLILADVDVRGIVSADKTSGKLLAAENVGAFCGTNNGKLENVQTARGYVTGGENVGGIAGICGTLGNELSNLKNDAQVSGRKNVGGIVGIVNDATMTNNTNKGIVCGYSVPDGKMLDGNPKPLYIGGIVGIAQGNANILNCVSNPRPQQGKESLSDEELQSMMSGNCVGGIVGRVTGGASVSGCAVGVEAAEDGENGGSYTYYVLGDSFVGGFVGYNDGSGVIQGASSTGTPIDGAGTCHAAVLGSRFVGGIAGANGKLKESASNKLETEPQSITHTDFEYYGTVEIASLSSKGLVAAVEKQPESAGGTVQSAYVGGVVGVNAGTVNNCTASQDDQAQAQRETLRLAKADYVGGVAGYNSGHIQASTADPNAMKTVTGLVEGRNFVGGVVGYNDGYNGGTGNAQGEITGYEIKDVSVTGENFAGGFAGLNTANSLVTNGEVKLGSKNIQGRSYVGGFAGANIMPNNVTINVAGGTVGNISANGAFTGGLFGYSRIAGADEMTRLSESGGLLDTLLNASGQNDSAPETGSVLPAMTDEQLQEMANKILALDSAIAVSYDTLMINGSSASAGGAPTGEANTITGQLFVGGVLGYHAQNSSLNVNKYIVDVSVGAVKAVSWSQFDKYGEDADGQPKKYSFSGGIVGYVPSNAELKSCRTTGTVETSGYYLGGLAEVNEGTITACAAAKLDGERDYVGGVVGLNGYSGTAGAEKPGVVKSCIVPQMTGADTATVRGKSFVGGIAAENLGTIESDAAGGFTGEVTGGGTVSGTEMNVGGIAGINRGTIQNIPAVTVNVDAPDAQRVGGAAGTNEGKILGVSTNQLMKVTGGADVGGLVGWNAAASGAAGGQIGAWKDTSSGKEVFCVNQANVTAANTAGGIAGRNFGSIDRASVEQAAIQAAGGSLGGLVGVNASENGISGTITLGGQTLYEAEDSQILTANSEGTAAYVGGIAGENQAGATITAASETSGTGVTTDTPKPVEVSLKWDGSASAAMGGIAGRNAGSIRFVRFAGHMTGRGNSAGGVTPAYGGIAGINEGTIANCGLGGEDLEMSETTDPSPATVASYGQNYLGGIAGYNGKNGTIASILEDESKTKHAQVDISSSNALATGGIVGLNLGTVGRDKDSASILESGESTEEALAQLDVETGLSWRIRAKGENAGPAGGLIGIQKGTHLYNLRNNAGLANTGSTNTETDEPFGVFSKGKIAGGIVGSVQTEIATEVDAETVIQSCANYGPVTASAHAGGIVGEWASAANGKVKDCVNGKASETNGIPAKDEGDTFALIQVTGYAEKVKDEEKLAQKAVASAAAGIFGGSAKLAQGQEIVIESCKNFGVVGGEDQLGAGIATVTGGIQAGDGDAEPVSAKITLTDCVNAGRIKQGAGIALMNGAGAEYVNAALQRCRNYGRPLAESGTEADDTSFAGILACMEVQTDEKIKEQETKTTKTVFVKESKLNPGQVSIQNCIGVADVTYPTVPMADTKTKEEANKMYQALTTLYNSVNNYYYSVLEGSTEPNPKDKAGIGSAVSYETGKYQNAYENEAHTDRDYLRALNDWTAEQEETGKTFDPNSKDATYENTYRDDCRGNYNRLDAWLAQVCVKLEEDLTKQDEQPAKPELSIRLMEEKDGKPVYGLILENGEAYKNLTNYGNLALALKLTNFGGETSGANAISENAAAETKKVRLLEFADGKPYPLYAETLNEAEAGNPLNGQIELEAWVCLFDGVSDGSGQETAGTGAEGGGQQTADPNTQSGGESGTPDGDEIISGETSDGTDSEHFQTVFTLPGTETLAILIRGGAAYISKQPADAGANGAEPTEGSEQTGATPSTDSSEQTDGTDEQEYHFEITASPAAEYRAEVLTQDDGVELHNFAAYSAVLNAENLTAALPAPEKSSARLYPIALTAENNSDAPVGEDAESAGASGDAVKISLGVIVAQNCSWEELKSGSYVANGDDAFVPGDGYSILKNESGSFDVYYSPLLKKDSELGKKCVLTDDEDALAAMIGLSTLYETESEPETEAQTEAQSETELITEPETEPQTFASEPQTLAGEPETEPQTLAGEPQTLADEPETEAQSEPEIETQSETESETKQKLSLLPPQGAQLSADWTVTCGTDEKGRSMAMPEEQFKDQITLTADTAENAGYYWMSAGFYTDAPADVRAKLDEQALYPAVSLPGSMTEDGAVNIWNNAADAEVIVANGFDSAAEGTDTAGQTAGTLFSGDSYGAPAVAGGAPDQARLLLELPEFNGQTTLSMNGGSYTFQNLPVSYGGAYLCVRFCCAAADGSGESGWSDYLWMRMPKVSIKTDGVSQTSVSSDYMMTIADASGVLTDIQSVSLMHPALSWKLELPDGSNANDAGWHIAFYDFVDAMLRTDSDEYDEPSFTVDLLRGADGEGYQIERALTEEEIKQWKKDNPNEPLPQYMHRTIPVEEDRDLFEKEHEINKKLKKAYTVQLNALTLGTDEAVNTYTQSVEGVGSYTIENVCPQIRILEYKKDVEKGILNDYIWIWLILPDVQQENPFLYNCTGILRTHSVTVEPLYQSRFMEQNTGVEAQRLQQTYLIRKESLLIREEPPYVQETKTVADDELLLYLRTLDGEQNINDAFDFQTEKEKNGFYDAEKFDLLPRNYAMELIRQSADAAASQQTEAVQNAGGAANENGVMFEDDGVVFEDDGYVQTQNTPQTENLPQAGNVPYETETPGVGIDTELLTERQTQLPAPAETQAPTEVQTQASTQMQTQDSVILEDMVGLGLFNRGDFS